MYQYDFRNRLFGQNAKKWLKNKSRINLIIRNHLAKNDFIEIDTPVLYPFPEIAPMEQFKAIDPITSQTYYLRVCPTEHLKRFMVAGFEKVFEFSRNFRPGNSSDLSHSSEFTSLECSVLGASYKDMMQLSEELIRKCVEEISESTVVNIDDKSFDLGSTWERVTVQNALLAETGIDVLDVDSDIKFREKFPSKLEDKKSFDQIIDFLIEYLILPSLSKPTFVTEYPYKLGGPAKPVAANNLVKERCEAFIGTLEIANMSSHLNDFNLLRKWHIETIELKKDLGISDTSLDEPLFDAIRLGLPDSAVVGIGIDRLAMISNGVKSIRQVIPFPIELMI